MPTVPVHQKELILLTENNHIPPAPQAAKEAALPDVRMQLADAVRQETKTHGSLSVEFMDRLASSYLTPQAADTPAGWDYAALRRSAQEQSQQIARQQQTHSLNQQAAWMEQVATATSDSASLKAYLTLQLPAYKKQLLQEGIPEEQADKTVEGIRSSSVQKHISRSLSGADWQTAQEVLAEQGDALPAAVRQQYAQQIRCQFSREVVPNIHRYLISPS